MEKELDIELYIINYLNGSMSKDQEREFLQWVNESGENGEIFSQYCARWELSILASDKNESNTGVNWRRTEFRINPGMRFKLSIKQFGRYAALIIIAFIAGMGAFRAIFIETGNKQVSWITNETPYASKSIITLPDGSQVWINAGTKLKYASDFNETGRILYLDGEAYFQVNTNRKKPFRVFTSGIIVTATGTRFNVRAYPEDNYVETTLVEGKVMVNREDELHDGGILMKPSQKLTFYKENNSTKIEEDGNEDSEISRKEVIPLKKEVVLNSNVETAVYTSWKDMEWIIQNEKLSSLAVDLQRRYNVVIRIDDPRVQDFAYTGKLKDETLEQVMNVICQTSPINYKLDGKNVIISFNEKYNKN
jgi:ferric-dicitrate binding protein FerR (iron transport regulator)